MSILSNVKAKVVCNYSRPAPGFDSTSRSVQLNAVYSNDPNSENYSFAKATPSASFTLWIDNPAAAEFFEEHAEYVVTFAKVEGAAK